MGQDRFYDVGVVVDSELVEHRQQQRVGLRNGLVFLQLFHQPVRFRGVGATENRPYIRVDMANLVPALLVAAEIETVAVVDQGKDAAADGDVRRSLLAGLGPGGAIGPDLFLPR